MSKKLDIIKQNLSEHEALIEKVLSEDLSCITEMADAMVGALRRGQTIFWCGNGGSASDGQHLAAELVGRFKKNRRALRSVALNTDTSVLTCIANDFSYDDIFSRQVEALGSEDDVLVCLSTSGNSPNILNALVEAKRHKMITVGLLGKGGGEAAQHANHHYIVNSMSTARIQEVHIMIGHILCELIENGLGLS